MARKAGDCADQETSKTYPRNSSRLNCAGTAHTLYRTIHRIAARDPAIRVGLDEHGRLEIIAGDERILWLRLDAKGEPYAFGFYDDEVGSLSGPWDFQADGIRHPTWVSSADGTWRAAVKTLSVNVPLQDHMFARPASTD